MKTKQLIKSFLKSYTSPILIMEGYLYDYGKKYFIQPKQLLKHITKSFIIHHPSTHKPFVIVIEYTTSPFHRNAVTIVDKGFIQQFVQYKKLMEEV